MRGKEVKILELSILGGPSAIIMRIGRSKVEEG